MGNIESKSLAQVKIEDYVARFRGVYLDRDKLNRIAKSLGVELCNGEEGETFFDAFGKRYRISSVENYVHKHGEGGEFRYRTFLNHEGDDVLFSRHSCSYITSSDEHEDFPLSEEKETFILKEDELTRKIWERVFGGRFY